MELTLGGGEVDDVAVALEHVDLLDGLDGLDVHLLKSSLELLVVTTTASVDLLDLSSGGALAAVIRDPSVSARCRHSQMIFKLTLHHSLARRNLHL